MSRAGSGQCLVLKIGSCRVVVPASTVNTCIYESVENTQLVGVFIAFPLAQLLSLYRNVVHKWLLGGAVNSCDKSYLKGSKQTEHR